MENKDLELYIKIKDAECEEIVKILSDTSSPNDFNAAIANTYEFAKHMIEKVNGINFQAVFCKSGCWYCCFQNVGISVLEAFRIASFIMNGLNNKESQDILIKRLKSLDRKTRGLSNKLHSRIHLPLYNTGNSNNIIQPNARRIVFNAVQEGIKEGIKKTYPNADNNLLELTAAIIYALNSKIDIIGWINGNDIFTNAHII